MDHLKEVLIKHGIASADIAKLEAFESRPGFSGLADEEFKEMQAYLGSFPVYSALPDG
jgi:hypothetical protein